MSSIVGNVINSVACNSFLENYEIRNTYMYNIHYVNIDREENNVYVSTPDGPQAALDLVVKDVLISFSHASGEQMPFSDEFLSEIEAFERLEWEFDGEITVNRFEPLNDGATEFARLEYCEVAESDPIVILKRLGLIK